MGIDEDKLTLNVMRIDAKLGGTLKQVLQEVSEMVKKVETFTIQATSGFAVCFYDTATGKPKKYIVHYQQGNMGNLVHELIHVAVNEAYGQDFLNYPNTSPGAPARTYNDKGVCTNEELRQGKLMNAGENTKNGTTLANLTRLAEGATELTAEQRKQVKDKFAYGIGKPHIEYDTVITQVLVWLHEWGFPTSRNRMNSPDSNRTTHTDKKVDLLL